MVLRSIAEQNTVLCIMCRAQELGHQMIIDIEMMEFAQITR